MEINGVSGNMSSNSSAAMDSNFEDFKTYAYELNRLIPDITTTVEEKEKAIEIKRRIMEHPQCPQDVKDTLEEEINIIQSEIDNMTSIYPKRDNLG